MTVTAARKVAVVVSLLLTAGLAWGAAADTVTLDFESFPGPDGMFGTADDVPAPSCPVVCGQLTNEFSSLGITFTSGTLGSGNLFPGSDSTNHFITSSPPDAMFSRPVTRISITSYSFWTATLYALDENSNVIASDTLTNPNAGSAFFLGTLSVSTNRPIRRFTVRPAGCQIDAGLCGPILNLDRLGLTFTDASIPTVSGWGFGGLVVLLGASGVIALRRRRAAGA